MGGRGGRLSLPVHQERHRAKGEAEGLAQARFLAHESLSLPGELGVLPRRQIFSGMLEALIKEAAQGVEVGTRMIHVEPPNSQGADRRSLEAQAD